MFELFKRGKKRYTNTDAYTVTTYFEYVLIMVSVIEVADRVNSLFTLRVKSRVELLPSEIEFDSDWDWEN